MWTCCKYYGQNTEDENEPREIFTMILTLAACENCKSVTVLLPMKTNKIAQPRGAKASITFVSMMIGLKAVKYVGKNI